jgi:tetratricopeptide (TPR) repeat protein
MERHVFVARERELGRLDGLLSRILGGHGQVCLVSGEAGSGKTALVMEFARRAQQAHADLVVAVGNCNAHAGVGDPYLPFREVLSLLTGDVEAKLAQGAITQENASRLRAFLVRSGQVLIEVGPGLVDLLVPGSRLIAIAGKTVAEKVGWLDELERLARPKQERPDAGEWAIEQSRIFEQYTNVLMALAVQQPVMLVVDDLQWADAASISLLFHLGRRIGGSRILIVGAYRPDEVALGRRGERHPLEKVLAEFKRYFGDVWVDLDKTTETESRQFVDAFLDTQPNRLGDDFRLALLQHTRGHPLFTIELFQDMQERGDLIRDEARLWIERSELDWRDLPPRVEGVIEERIGRLEGELRDILTVASVEGAVFTAQVVARVQSVDERGLVRRLSEELERQHRLVHAQGIRQVGRQRLSVYSFRHSLFQMYLYNDLDEVERAYLHEDVGNALEVLYGDRVHDIAVQLAWHYDEAGVAEKAIDYLLQAGDGARRVYANEDAVEHYRRALALLEDTLPEELPDDWQREVATRLHEGLGDVLTLTGQHDEALEHLERARNLLTGKRGMTQHLADLYRKTAMLHERKSEYQAAFEWLEHGLSVLDDDTALEVARIRLAGAGIYARQGKHRQALDWCKSGLAIARQRSSQPVLAHATYLMATIHGHLGRYEEAIAGARQSLALYEKSGDHAGQIKALNNLGAASRGLGDWQATIKYYRRGIELAEKIGDVNSVAIMTHNLGNILLEQGNLGAAVRAYERSLDKWEIIGFPFGVAASWSGLGKAYTGCGEWERALDCLGRSERQFKQIESDLFLPEVYRRQAVIHLNTGQLEMARQLVEQSIALATELDMALERGISLRVRGQIDLASEQWEQAEVALRESLKILQEQGNRYRMGETLYHLGRLYWAMARGEGPEAAAKAKSALERARTIFEDVGAERDLARVKEVLK